MLPLDMKRLNVFCFNLAAAPAKVAVSREESYAEKLLAIDQLRGIPGQLLRSSAPVELTESETEYVVKCVRHSFPHHLVLQVKRMVWKIEESKKKFC